MKLTQEEKEQLAALVGSPTWKALHKALDLLIDQQADRVLTASDVALSSEKKKYEGMKLLKIGIESLKGNRVSI